MDVINIHTYTQVPAMVLAVVVVAHLRIPRRLHHLRALQSTTRRIVLIVSMGVQAVKRRVQMDILMIRDVLGR